MTEFPKLEGVIWISKKSPEIVKLPITLLERKSIEMGLDNIPETQSYAIVDIHKLASIRPFYEEDSDIPSKTECVIDVMGMPTTVVNVSVKNMLAAWEFSKYYPNI